MAKTTTAKELFDYLKEIIDKGYGHAEILFDTDARKFDYHMAKIGDAHLEIEPFPDRPFIGLYEERK